MGALFLAYIIYCVVVLYIPQSRQFLIDGVMKFVHAVMLALKVLVQPELWKAIGALVLVAIVIALVVSGVGEILNNVSAEIDSGGKLLFILILMAILLAVIVALFYVLGWMIAIGAVVTVLLYVGPVIIGIAILMYLPAAVLLLYKYTDYQANPHQADPQFRQIQVKDAVLQEDVDAVKEAMLQSDKKGFSIEDDGLVNVKNVLFGWVHSENRKEHLRRLREEMEEETESLNAFREYVRAKNRKHGSEYDE